MCIPHPPIVFKLNERQSRERLRALSSKGFLVARVWKVNRCHRHDVKIIFYKQNLQTISTPHLTKHMQCHASTAFNVVKYGKTALYLQKKKKKQFPYALFLSLLWRKGVLFFLNPESRYILICVLYPEKINDSPLQENIQMLLRQAYNTIIKGKNTSFRLTCSINILFCALLCKTRYKKAQEEWKVLLRALLKMSHRNQDQLFHLQHSNNTPISFPTRDSIFFIQLLRALENSPQRPTECYE